jgi:tetratricopeptide (TPR) repeat protein
MATAGDGDNGPRDWKRRESLGSALAQIGVVAVLLAAAVHFYVQRGRQKQETEAQLQQAREQAQRGNPADLEAALKQLDALFARDDTVYEAHLLAADLRTTLWLEHHVVASEGPAREHLGRAERLENAGRSGARVVRARVLQHEGRLDEAATTLEGLQEKGATHPGLWLALARVRQARGDLPGARQAFSKAAELGRKDPRYASAQGEALLEEGLTAQAHEAFQKATQAHPEHVQARLGLALARLLRGEKPEEVLRTVQEVTAREAGLTPLLKSRLLTVRAELALSRGGLEEAQREADAALVQVPDEPQALLTRARVLAARKDAGARAAFERAVAQRPTAPLPYLEGARALRQAGDSSGALALEERYKAAFRDVPGVPKGEAHAPASAMQGP